MNHFTCVLSITYPAYVYKRQNINVTHKSFSEKFTTAFVKYSCDRIIFHQLIAFRIVYELSDFQVWLNFIFTKSSKKKINAIKIIVNRMFETKKFHK